MSAVDAQVAQVYVSLFGRAPDAEGLAYWAGRLESGESLANIADAMFATTPARLCFPDGASSIDVIASIYENVLGRAPDPDGLAYWTHKLGEAGETHGSVIAGMITTAAHYAGTDAEGLLSARLFLNRAAASLFYAENGGSIENATHVVDGITTDVQSVVTARTLVVDGASGTVNVGGFTSATVNFGDTSTTQFLCVSNAHLDSMVVTGSGSVWIQGGPAIGVGAAVNCQLIDAAGFTGSLCVALSDGATLRGGASADHLSATSSEDAVVDGGAGNDFVGGSGSITLMGGGGNDEFGPAASWNGGFATIADFQNGTDSISLEGMIGPVAIAGSPQISALASAQPAVVSYPVYPSTWHSEEIVLVAGKTFGDYLDAAAQAQASQNAAISWFRYGGETYIVVDNSSPGTFQQNMDHVVKLVGQIDLSTLAYNVNTGVLS